MDLQPDFILKDRYQIIRKLGQGGMGSVFLARDLSLDHVVAVKANRTTAEQGTNQFLREARLLATLRHPNLPRVTDHFIIGTDQYLVMDYIPGEDLEATLKQHGALRLSEALRIIHDLADALTYLHNQNPPVVHRDIKPSNIKITPEGETVLVDFGIAKVTDPTQATTTGAMGFTPGFAPPEQYGTGRTGPFTDQYALAATLYKLLTNTLPADALQRLMGQAVLTPLHLLNKDIPAHVEAAIEKAMSPKPEARFASVKEFLQALESPVPVASPRVVQASVMPAVDSTTPILKPGRMPKKKTGMLWLGVLAGVVVLGVGGFILSRVLYPPGGQITATVDSLSPGGAAVVGETSTPQMAAWTTTPEPTATSTLEPTLTPTPFYLGGGARVAYISDRADGHTLQIWLMTLALSPSGEAEIVSNEQLTYTAGDKTQPAWSPDGTRLLYVASSEDTRLGLDIWMMDLRNPGIAPVDLTNYRGDETDPAWSPAGDLIAFSNAGGMRSDGVRQLFLMNADGSDRHRISYDLQEFSPTWSPNGQSVLFVVAINSGQVLYFRSAADEFVTVTQYDSAELGGRQGVVDNPAWSPSGEFIAYTRLDGNQRYVQIMPYRGRGNDMVRLTNSGADYDPAWSNDDQWILFTSERDGNAEIYIMNAAGALQRNLTQNPGRDMQAAWALTP